MRPGNTKLLLFPSKYLAKNRKKKNERQKEGRKRRGKIRKGGKGDGRRVERGVKRRDGEEKRDGEVGLGVGGEGLQVVIGTSPYPHKLPERVNFSSFLSTRAKEAVMRLFIPRKKLHGNKSLS